MNKSPIEAYALQATLRSVNEIHTEIDRLYGFGTAKKNPAMVSTLLRFQEQMIQSTTELVVANKVSIKELQIFTDASQ